MKVSKTEVAKFLKSINLKGIINEVVIEENGTVTLGHDGQMMITGGTNLRFTDGKRIGINNLSLLLKIIETLESEDNTVNIAITGSSMIIAARSGKYDFRLADADTLESMPDDRAGILELFNKSIIKLEIPQIKIANLKKSISTLSADRVKIEVSSKDKVVNAVVYDDKTLSTATIELGDCTDGDFMNTYSADLLTRALDMAEGDMVEFATSMDLPLFVKVKQTSFCYMLSPWKKLEEANESALNSEG